jgi:4-alpha-glucanotransferase
MISAERRAGLMVPLFSVRSAGDWGIGEIGGLGRVAQWLDSAGQRVVQLLPINELPAHETSPYSSLSGMAIDPVFISLAGQADFEAIGGEGGLEPQWIDGLTALRASRRVNYRGARAAKDHALRRAFARFDDVEVRARSTRAEAFGAFVDRERWWIDDYALFRALHHEHGGRPWGEWPAALRDREPQALEAARIRLDDEIRYRLYLQWIADGQWREARNAAGDVAIFGDLPFMVALDSADVWARQGEFRLDLSLGVPPDAFSDTGQDWNLPVYRWDVMERSGFEWLTARARRNADLFDGYRVDHLVGFFRTFFREPGGASGFTPDEEPAQVALGEHVLRVFLASGATIVAEDLGVVPGFVRAAMSRLGVPGCKVFRWERHWHQPGQPFVDPAEYPVRSMATTGTHDTEPMVTWWQNAPPEERAAVISLPIVRHRLGEIAAAPVELTAELRVALLEAVYASRSELVIVPVQDAFGWTDRINTPAVVDDVNWTWRLPWEIERMSYEPVAQRVAALLRELALRHGR